MDSYNSQTGAEEYIKFINSQDGEIEKAVLYKAVRARLNGGQARLLDAGCGTGWLAGKLAEEFTGVFGCDASGYLIDYAKGHYPKVNFHLCDLTQTLPYEKNFFDDVVVNMAIHDLADQKKALANIYKILKPGGKLILTIANPYYSLPVGVWKRGLVGRLFFSKPKLQLRPYNLLRKQTRKFSWGALSPYFYPLSEQVNTALACGFTLKFLDDLQSENDSKKFDLTYRLYRYPYLLLLEFAK